MKKNLLLLSLVGLVSLAACSAPLAVPARTDLPTRTEPVAVISPTVTPVFLPTPTTPSGPEQSWTEVTGYSAERPLTGDVCTAAASRLDTGQVSVISVGCTGVSFATVHVVEASGRDTPQIIGAQNLVITQRAQGVKIAEPTFRVVLEGKQIWPR